MCSVQDHHIGLVHNSTGLDLAFVPADQRPELFGPIVRVTNIYSGLRAIGFDSGFSPKIRKNHLIVPDTVVRCTFTHRHRDSRQAFRRLCVSGNAWQGIAA